MSRKDHFLSIINERSRLVIAIMLVISLALGSGMAMVDEDTSLEQFETDSPEVEKLEYVQDNFGAEEDNTTAAQVVVRGDNTLDRDALIATLELQLDFRENNEISNSLAEDPFNDLAQIIAQVAIIEERQEILDDRADQLDFEADQLEQASEELEAEGEQLENESEELEEASEELEADRADLEERQAELEADQADLEERAGVMTQTLDQVRDAQSAYDAGEITEPERDAQIEALAEAASDELTEEQFDAFEPLIEDARAIQAEMNEVQGAYEAGQLSEEEYEQQMGELQEDMEQIYGAIQGAVLAEAFADLEERGDDLEEDGQELEERGAELEAWGEELEERGEDLDERADELEDWGDDLEERGDRLEDDYEALGDIDPSAEEAIEQLESMTNDEVADQVASTLDEDADSDLFVFLPNDFEPGTSQADARMLFVTQGVEEATGFDGEAPDHIIDSQLAMAGLVDDRFEDGFVFGDGILTEEMDRSLTDSMAIVLPLALLFVTLVLVIAYRDFLDIVLGLLGVVFVLIWTFGFLGWAGIPFTIIMIAVPVLLVGLSVDYAIHVFMRHREQRTEERDSTRRAMHIALGGVGLALIWVTATAMIGFLSNLISPIGPLREFGIASSFGIASALIIFGVFIPAIKVETDAFLESRGYNREKRAFGTGGGVSTRFLSKGQQAAGRLPWAVVLVALLLTVGGVAGATQVDTSFEMDDFLADDPDDWMKELPSPFAPGDYTAKENLDYLNEHFQLQGNQVHLLAEGEVTQDDTLERMDAAEGAAVEKETSVVLADGSLDVDGPLSVMESVAEENESFNETFTDADTTGDDIPNENLTAVFDAFFEADEDAASEVIYRTDGGSYEAVQMIIAVDGGAPSADVTNDMRAVATDLDGGGLEATATGQLIVFHVIESQLFETVIESLLITLVVVFAFLMIGYRWKHGSALLGAITLMPIVFAVAWILGTMYLLGIPFNVMTGTITSLTVGLGIAYNIHMSERYILERRRGYGMLDAMYTAVTGTGGALFGSAATTIGGFGVLMFAILPPLQQFGLITGLTIFYAFLGSVFILPSFLVLWSMYLAPPGLDATSEIDGGTSDVAAGTD